MIHVTLRLCRATARRVTVVSHCHLSLKDNPYVSNNLTQRVKAVEDRLRKNLINKKGRGCLSKRINYNSNIMYLLSGKKNHL